MHFCELNELRGHRAEKLALPPDWDGADGVWQMLDVDGQVLIRNRFTKATVPVPEQFKEFAIGELKVTDNFSEERARIQAKVKGGPPSVTILGLTPLAIPKQEKIEKTEAKNQDDQAIPAMAAPVGPADDAHDEPSTLEEPAKSEIKSDAEIAQQIAELQAVLDTKMAMAATPVHDGAAELEPSSPAPKAMVAKAKPALLKVKQEKKDLTKAAEGSGNLASFFKAASKAKDNSQLPKLAVADQGDHDDGLSEFFQSKASKGGDETEAAEDVRSQATCVGSNAMTDNLSASSGSAASKPTDQPPAKRARKEIGLAAPRPNKRKA